MKTFSILAIFFLVITISYGQSNPKVQPGENEIDTLSKINIQLFNDKASTNTGTRNHILFEQTIQFDTIRTERTLMIVPKEKNLLLDEKNKNDLR